MNRRHPVGGAEQFILSTGLNRLRFAAAEDLLDLGAEVVDETGRGRLSGARLILAVQATRATHLFESVVALCRMGRGAPASMLNRALFEDALDVHWVAAHPEQAPALADEHEALIRLAEREMELQFGRPAEPLTEAELIRLAELRKRFNNFNASWTLSSVKDRLSLIKARWSQYEDAAYHLDYTYDVIQRQNNVILHPTPSGYGMAMSPGREQINRAGPDPRWRDALGHGVLAYYLTLKVIAEVFDLDKDPIAECFNQTSCYLKPIPQKELATQPADAPCPCGSGRATAKCHGLG